MSKNKNIQIRVGAGPNRNNNANDILQLKQALESLGYYDTPSYGITPYPDDDIFSSIKRFQTDMGLKIDGVVKPKGETEKAIDQQLNISNRSPQMI